MLAHEADTANVEEILSGKSLDHDSPVAASQSSPKLGRPFFNYVMCQVLLLQDNASMKCMGEDLSGHSG
jgi:hypothetical protein